MLVQRSNPQQKEMVNEKVPISTDKTAFRAEKPTFGGQKMEIVVIKFVRCRITKNQDNFSVGRDHKRNESLGALFSRLLFLKSE